MGHCCSRPSVKSINCKKRNLVGPNCFSHYLILNKKIYQYLQNVGQSLLPHGVFQLDFVDPCLVTPLPNTEFHNNTTPRDLFCQQTPSTTPTIQGKTTEMKISRFEFLVRLVLLFVPVFLLGAEFQKDVGDALTREPRTTSKSPLLRGGKHPSVDNSDPVDPVQQPTTDAKKISNDLHFDPPSWIQDYIQFHQNHVRNGHLIDATTPYMQYQCLHTEGGHRGQCGGLGDRLKGILMGAFFAMVDKRVYLVNWDDWSPLSDYLAPAHIDWLAQPPSKNSNQTSDIEEFSTFSDKDHPYMNNPCAWHSDHTGVSYRSNVFKAQRKMNEACVQDFFGQEPIDLLMYHSLFWTLFKFTDRTREAARQVLSKSSVDPNYFVAVHIRAGGKGTTFDDPTRHGTTEDWQSFSKCTALVQTELERKCGSRPGAYVASDSEEAKEYMTQHGTDVHATPVEIYHIDRSDMTRIENVTLASDAVWGEFKVLMDSTCTVVGKSGFSRLSTNLARAQPHCTVSFEDCSVERVQEAVSQYAQCR